MIRNKKRVSDRMHGKIVQACLLTTAFLVVLLGAGLAGADIVPANRRTEFYNNLSLLGEVYERIINNYVDEVDPHVILKAGIEGMLESLDEHSNYLPPVDYEDLMMSTEGEFGGLGISINIRDHFPTVVSPIEGTPAYYMGIQGGDQIVEIEGQSSFDFTSREAVKLLRGLPEPEMPLAFTESVMARIRDDEAEPFCGSEGVFSNGIGNFGNGVDYGLIG